MVVGSIVGWSLRFRFLVLAIAGTIAVVAVVQLPNAPVDALPEFTPPYVEVQTEALGLSADEVAELITVPLEADLLHGVAWLKVIHSESIAGLSSIVLVFEPGTDVIRARQMVAERLTQAHALPNVSKPPVMLQPLSSASRVMMIGLSSSQTSLIDMSVLARWVIRPRLLGVPGVANVAIWGQRDRQLQVLVDPQRLRQERVTLQGVIETVGNSLWASPLTFIEAATPGTGGFIDTPNQRIGIQHVQPIRTPADMAKVPIEDKPGLVLSDVASIVEDHQPLIGDAVVNDGDGLFMVVEKFPDANTAAVTRGVEAALAALQPGLGGMTVDTSVFRPASFIDAATRNLGLALLIGLLLAALVLGLLLDWRAAVLTVVVTTVSLLTAALVLSLLGATINLMVAAGFALALGLIVDDVVVRSEAVARRFRAAQRAGEAGDSTAIVKAAFAESDGPAVYSAAIIGVALLPVAVVAGSAAAFLPHIAAAYLVAVLAALSVALTVGPAITSLLLTRSPGAPRGARLGRRLAAGYAALLPHVIGRARIAFGTVALAGIGVVLVAVSVAPQLGQSMLPQLREPDLLVSWEAAPGTSRAEMNRILARAGSELRGLPGVRNVGGHVGRAITSDQVASPDAAQLWVNVDPAADYDATLAAIDDVVGGYPGLSRAVTTYSAERIDQVLNPAERDISVRIYGQSTTVLRQQADTVLAALRNVPGVVSPTIDDAPIQPTIDIEVDLAAAEAVGLKPGDIRRAATSLLSGIEVGFLFEEQKVFEVVVWGAPAVRQSLTSIGNLQIDTPSGEPVRLADVASVSVRPGPASIRREGVMRIVDVGATIDGAPDAVMRDVDAALAGIAFPLEYHAEVRSAAADERADQQRLLVALLVAAIGVFLLLQAAFESWRLAALTFITLPAAMIGGVLAAYASGAGTFSLGAIAGLVAVMAIAVRNGIMLIVRFRALEAAEPDVSAFDLMDRAARDRFRPIVLTALTTALAMLPFVVLGNLPGFEVVRPMAIVILGGLASTTLATLFALPAISLRSGPSPEAEEADQAIEPPALSPA